MTQQTPVHLHTPIRTFPSVHESLQDILFVGRRLLLLPLRHGVFMCVGVGRWPLGLYIDSPVSTSVMFCSLPDRLAQFAINTPSSRSEALPDGAGAICLADACLLTGGMCVCMCVREGVRRRKTVCVRSYFVPLFVYACVGKCVLVSILKSACIRKACVLLRFSVNTSVSPSVFTLVSWIRRIS